MSPNTLPPARPGDRFKGDIEGLEASMIYRGKIGLLSPGLGLADDGRVVVVGGEADADRRFLTPKLWRHMRTKMDAIIHVDDQAARVRVLAQLDPDGRGLGITGP